MKKLIVLVLMINLLWSCHSADDSAHMHLDAVATNEVKTEQHQDDKKISLNNGAKWQADASTNANVENLSAIATKYKNDANIASYKAAGEELQAGLNKLVSECKMKGPEHDALHLWLEPFMGTVKDFNKSTNKDSASSLLAIIDAQLKEYPTYFK